MEDQPTLDQSVQLQGDIEALKNQRVHQQDIVPSAIKPKHLAAGTGSSKGNLYYSDGTNFTAVAPGTASQVLGVSNGLPSWKDITTAAATQLATNTTPVTINGATAPTAGQVLTATSATAANWQTPSAAISLQLVDTSHTYKVQFGSATASAGGSTSGISVTVNYPTGFSTIVGAWAGGGGTGSIGGSVAPKEIVGVDTITNTGCRLIVTTGDASNLPAGTYYMCWQAIGY